MSVSERENLGEFQDHLDDYSDRTIRTLDIMARALHVKNGELQPTLDAIVSTAVNALSLVRHADFKVR